MKKLTSTVRGATFVAALAFTQFASAQSTWTSATSGDWTNDANWTGGIPNAISAIAIFSNNWTGQLITNEAATVGQILATDTTSGGGVANAALTITGGTLTLDNGASKAIISTGTNNAFSENSRFKIASVLDGTNGFERQGSGYLDLSGTVNLFTGTIMLNSTNSGGGSFTVINSDANFGNATNTIQVGLGATATGFYNDGSAGAFTLNANRSIVTSGTGDFWVKNKTGANMTIAGVISGTARLRKNDSGSLTLTGSNTFTGGVLLDGGTLFLAGGDNRIASNSTVQFNTTSTLDLGSTEQTLARLIGAITAVTNTISGSTGRLVVNGNFAFTPGGANGLLFNMSGLNHFVFDRAGQNFSLVPNSGAGSSTNELHLAAAGSGINTISASQVLIGTASASTGTDNLAILRLGATNTINTTTFRIGGFNGRGSVNFQSGLSAPVLTLRGTNGTAAVTSLSIGNTSSGVRSGAGTLDLTGGSLDALVTTITIGNNTTAIADNSSLTMPDGTVVAGTLKIGTTSGAGSNSPDMTNSFSQGGGSVTVTNLIIGENAAAGGSPNFIATYSITGGTLYAGSVSAGSGAVGAATTRNVTLNGGGAVLRNIAGSDLTIDGLGTASTNRINIVIGASGGTLEADVARNITVDVNALISGAGNLTKAGDGTLTVNSVSTHTGATTIGGGSLVLGASGAISTNTLIFGGTAGGLFDLGGQSYSLSTITTTFTGAGSAVVTNGALTLSANANLVLGGRQDGSVIDFSGLSQLTYNQASRAVTFNVGNGATTTTNRFKLSLVDNAITAGTVTFGGSSSAGLDNAVVVELGAANSINTGTFQLGAFNSTGSVAFASGLTAPELVLRGSDGSGALGTLKIGETSSGVRAGSGTLDLSGGTLDALITDIIIGRHVAGANNTDASTFTMAAGSLDATTLLMAQKTGTGAPTLTSTFNQLGGDVTISTVTLGDDAGAGATARLLPTINIDGGTFKATMVQIGGGAFATNSARSLNIGTATLQNIAGTDLTISSTDSTEGGRINVGLTGAATFEADAARTITIGVNTLLTGSGSLTKTGAGTLTLSGALANDYSGATTVSAGTMILDKTAGVSAISGSALTVASGATLLIAQSNQVDNSATVTLSGGTISRGSGVSEVFGNLNLITGSFLEFGTGSAGTMAFGTYTPSSLLTVQNFLPGNVLTFGSDLSTTIGDGDYFSFDSGFTSSWDSGSSTFTITAIPEPSTYLVAAGLLVLMLCRGLRRPLEDAESQS
jgi:autotransporter-associated beta strand protein